MIYSFNSDILYYVNIYDIQVLKKNSSKLIRFDYPEAAVLDFLIKGYSDQKIINMISYIGSYTENKSKKIYKKTVELLIKENIIKKG